MGESLFSLMLAVAETAEPVTSLFDRGGWVMWPLAACSIIGVALIVERFFVFSGAFGANRFFRKEHQEALAAAKAGKWDEALKIARACESGVGRIFAAALANRENGFTECLESAARQEIFRLRKHLSTLDTMITASPMLGILGTVTGIIKTFGQLNAAGLDHPAVATAGISEALITTAAGLIIALALLFPYHYFTSKIRRYTEDLEKITTELEVAKQYGEKRPVAKQCDAKRPVENPT